MLFGNGKARSRASRRPGPAFRPGHEALEARLVLTAVDLAQIAGPAVGATGLGPFGVQQIGATPNLGAGYTVAAVGDVNGDGLQDFVIGAPGVVAAGTGGAAPYVLNSTGAGSTAYLVLGSSQATVGGGNTVTDWLTLTQTFRSGDLSQLGSTAQTNPITGSTGSSTYNFNGLMLTTSANATSQLGASASAIGDVNGDGFGDFILGAPGANGGNGAAYVVYGSASLGTRTTKTLDLDTGAPDVAIREFTNTTTIGIGSRTGYSVANAGNFVGTGTNTNGLYFGGVAIGAPNASVNGLNNNGAVFVVPNSILSAAPAFGSVTTQDLSTIGQGATATTGVVFSGAAGGAVAGFAVAGAGDVDSSGTGDLLVGAPAYNPFANPTSPSITGPGMAYLVYGGTNFQAVAVTPTVGGFLTVPLNYAGGTGSTTSVPGASFVGAAAGDRTGFALSTTGQATPGFVIGSPGFTTNTGRVNVIYGNAASGTGGAINGIFTLSALPSTILNTEFDGTTQGDLAGWSVSVASTNLNSAATQLLIGSPGALANAGAVYSIPQNSANTGIFSLTNVQASPTNGTLITNSTTASGVTSKNFLGSSVAGTQFPSSAGSGSSRTADIDTIPDFAIGASGFSLNTTRSLAGAAFFVEGGLIPAAPVTTPFTVSIGVNAAAGASNYTVNNTLTSIQIFVNSSVASGTTPAFNPVTDIDPSSLIIDGVLAAQFIAAGGSVTIARDPVDENGDGIPDAIITATPASTLGLALGAQTFTFTGTTLSTAANPSAPFAASTTNITVTNGGGNNNNNNGGNSSNLPLAGTTSSSFGFPLNNVASSTIGERLVPQLNTLSQLRWKAITVRTAYRQFLPPPGFRQRQIQKFGGDVPASHSAKSKYLYSQGRSNADTSGGQSGVATLAGHVFNRGIFKINARIGSYHRVPKKGYIG